MSEKLEKLSKLFNWLIWLATIVVGVVAVYELEERLVGFDHAADARVHSDVYTSSAPGSGANPVLPKLTIIGQFKEELNKISQPAVISQLEEEINKISPVSLFAYYSEGAREYCLSNGPIDPYHPLPGDNRIAMWQDGLLQDDPRIIDSCSKRPWSLKEVYANSVYALGRFFGGGLTAWIVLIGAYALFFGVVKGSKDDYHAAIIRGAKPTSKPSNWLVSHIFFFFFWYGFYASIVKWILLGVLNLFGVAAACVVYAASQAGSIFIGLKLLLEAYHAREAIREGPPK